MKKLKLNHELAELVQKRAVTSTWRLFDDKDLTVGDAVLLIDKIDEDKPQSWKAIGVARINQVIEKRLVDITERDYDGHNPYASRDDMLTAYRGYYGNNVVWDTPVKIIHFDFDPSYTGSNSSNGQAAEHKITVPNVILYADGGSRGNPGPSACGYVIMNDQEEVLVDKGVYLGITTNNQAEYQGLKLALEEAMAMNARNVAVRLDSLLVVNQMKGVYNVKNRDLWPIHDAVQELVKGFELVSFTHVPRELNQLADAAVNRVLDEAAREHSRKQ